MATTEPKKIRLGICMAGAVSAGAYTAGVIDYLVETLERWQRKKDNINKKKAAGEQLTAEEELVPLYDVVIEVLSGASAGGMTAAVLAYSFNDGTYITRRNNEMIPENYNCPADSDTTTKLYKSWINMVDDEKGTTFSKLMETSDVVGSLNQMPSLLNSTPIDQIAAKAVPVKINFQPPAYISEYLSIVLSVTNIEGVPVDIRFSNIDETNPTRNVLWMHSGYLHYQFKEQDYSLEFPPEIVSDEFKDHLAVAAKATGAFPFGLTNRRIFVNSGLFNEFKRRMKENKMNVNAKIADGSYYVFTAVDGGAINNEPVGTTVRILDSKKKLHHKEEENYVILIDPFPTVTNASQENIYQEPGKYTLTAQALKLLSVFRNQSSFKQEDLQNGLEMEENTFLIYPAKRRHYYLACGEIGGFSGFMKKSFRQHDYQLGRKNCQAFLRYYFGEDIQKFQTITNIPLTQAQLDKWSYNVNYGKKDKPEELKFPFIPDMLVLDSKRTEIAGPEYDGVTTAEMKTITDSIDQRIKKITDTTYPSLSKMGKSMSPFVGLVMNMWPFKGILKNKIRKALSGKVNTYLHKTFSPQFVKQETLVTKFADIIEHKGKLYQKIKGVYAKIANGGEKITSHTAAGLETVNIASHGDYIVQNETAAKEKYIVKPLVFNDRYVHSHDDYYVPNEKTRVFGLQLTGDNIYQYSLTGFETLITEPNTDAFIEAPWKESQKIQLNDYLVCLPLKNEVYRIAKIEFDATYKAI